MVSTASYNVSGVLYDSDSEPVEYEGNSYQYYLESDFNCGEFKEDYLAKYIGKGPNMEHVLLVIPSVTPKVNENYEDSLRYIIKTLDQHLTTIYSLLICQTCVSWSDSNSYYFVNQWYNMLPTSKKKNLSKVYLVHAPVSTKTLLTLSTPFNSSKCLGKVEFVENLSDILHKLELNKKNMLRYFPYIVQRTEEINLGITRPLSPFTTELWALSSRLGKRFKDFKLIPPVLSNILVHLESEDFVSTPNILNLQCDASTLYEVVTKVENTGENCKFNTVNEAVSVFKLFLDTQTYGLLGQKAYVTVKNAVLNNSSFEEVQEEMKEVVSKLKPEHSECVYCIIKTLRAIARNVSKNGMNTKLMSKIMAPSFFRPHTPDPYVHTVIPMCEKLVNSMIDRPGVYFKIEKETHTKLVKTSESERKSKEHREKEEKSREHKSRESSDKHGTRHKSKESSKSERSRESSKSDSSRLEKSSRDGSRSEKSHRESSTSIKHSRDDSKHKEDLNESSTKLVSGTTPHMESQSSVEHS